MINVKTLVAVVAAALLGHAIVHPSAPGPHSLPTCFRDCHIDNTGLALLKQFEGYYPYPYKDPVGIITVGFGHVVHKGEKIPAPLIGSAAVKLLKEDAGKSAMHVNRLINVPLHPGQADALISFTFNLGTGTLEHSTLRRRVNARQNQDVPNEFMKWVYAGGHVLPGLVRRRRAEAQLYATGD